MNRSDAHVVYLNQRDVYGHGEAENVNFFGDNRVERLPNSDLPIRLSYLWWQDKDPRDNREWTPPHIAVEMSYEDYISNRDPVLEHILSNKTFEFIRRHEIISVT